VTRRLCFIALLGAGFALGLASFGWSQTATSAPHFRTEPDTAVGSRLSRGSGYAGEPDLPASVRDRYAEPAACLPNVKCQARIAAAEQKYRLGPAAQGANP
jgi:hypothetical protein